MRTICLLLPLLFCSAFLCMSEAQQAPDRKLVILHTNDLHSRLNGFAPEAEYTPLSLNDDGTVGGFARIAGLIAKERKENGDNVLVLDAGDFLMGTLFAMLEESTGFQLPLMKKMGYDMVTLGNHEFDFGPGVLAEIINRSVENGPVPLIVSSSLSFSEKETGDDALKVLYDKGIIKPYYLIEKNKLRVGVFGMPGYSAIGNAPLARPVKFEDPVKTARKYARLLKNTEKADLVICLAHVGITKDKDGNWSGESVELARKIPEIDIIISGHTHTLLEKPVIINGIPIVQTGSYGKNMGRVELTFSGNKVKDVESKLIPVNDAIPGDPDIQRQITQQEKKVSEIILRPLRLELSTIVAETSFPLIFNEETQLESSNLGPLVTDAVYSYVNHHDKTGTDITLFPAGLIFDDMLPSRTGMQSVADIFRIVPMGSGQDKVPGYPLARIFVTGKELKGIMEILYLAPKSSPANYIYFGGLKAGYNPEKGLLKKITSIEIGDPVRGYTPVDWSRKNKQLYSITADSYVLEFVGLIKKLSYHLVKVTLKNEKGERIKSVNDAVIDADPDTPGIQEMKEWISLSWFLQQQPDINGNRVSDIPGSYRSCSPRLYRE